MSISQEQIFKTYVADSPVDVYYYIITYDKISMIVIKAIIVMPDNRPLYRTRTKELKEAIINLIEDDLAIKNKNSIEKMEEKCITSV